MFPGENAWKSSLGVIVGGFTLTMKCRAIAVSSSVQCCPQWEMQRLVDNFYMLISTVGVHFGPQAVACTLASIYVPQRVGTWRDTTWLLS